MLASTGMIKAYAEENHSFGVRLIPDKLIENSEGILQVYGMNNDHISPQKIENLVFSSSDSSKVQIIGIENSSSSFITNIKLKAEGKGDSKIELGAPGFSSKEIPITVYGNQDSAISLLMKTTPSTFSTNGPQTGYFTVEIANNDGVPVTATEDMTFSLTTTNNRVLTLTETQITIKTGEYYAIGKFEVKQAGSSQIFASYKSLQSSTLVTVNSVNSPTIQTYVYPQKINNYAASITYAIAQLKDPSGILMPAKEDIIIPVSILDPNANLTNSSPQIDRVAANAPITIKKGSYWGYTSIGVKAGINGTYSVLFSAPNGYSTSGRGTITTATAKFFDNKSARLDILPILATGKEELVGILHLEDKNQNPVIANADLQIEVDSSNPTALSIDKVNIGKGFGVAPVFGRVGTSIPSSSVSLHVMTYNDTTITPTISVPTSNSFNLIAQPLVSKILSRTTFPIAIFMSDASGNPTYFPGDSVLKALPNDYFSIEQTSILKGDPILITNSSALKDGTANLNLIVDNYQTTINLQTANFSPAQVIFEYPDPFLSEVSNKIAVQILDANSNPISTQKDIYLSLVSSNNQVLPLPDTIKIPKNGYYASIDVTPQSVGTSEVSILADNLPLSDNQIKVDSLSPTLDINTPDNVVPGETFFVTVKAEDHGEPLKNMKIQWKVNGATIQNIESITNKNGTANLVLLANAANAVSLNANATGFGYMPAQISKIVKINDTGSNVTTSTNSSSYSGVPASFKSFKINGMDPLPIIILGAITVSGILIKKKSLLSFKRNLPGSTRQTK